MEGTTRIIEFDGVRYYLKYCDWFKRYLVLPTNKLIRMTITAYAPSAPVIRLEEVTRKRKGLTPEKTAEMYETSVLQRVCPQNGAVSCTTQQVQKTYIYFNGTFYVIEECYWSYSLVVLEDNILLSLSRIGLTQLSVEKCNEPVGATPEETAHMYHAAILPKFSGSPRAIA